LLQGIHKPGSRHDLEALVHADQIFGRHDRTLNGVELGTFDLSRDGAQLVGRIDLGFDAAA
jgi:hypothetical protein